MTDALSHFSTASYNRCTGQPVVIGDQNTKNTAVAYDDPLLRTTSVTYPDNTTTTPSIQYSYPHTPGYASLSTEQRTFQNPATQLKTMIVDALGRVTSVTTSDPGGDDIVATHYDAEGRPYTVSNPYRSGTTPDNTTFTYDALGRKTLVTYPDSTTATATFSSNTVAYGGTGASARTLVYDALGNISQVQEPNPAGGSALLTDYVSDGNGNVTQITQNGNGTSSEPARQRNFAYDSLGRLLSAKVPESGVTCYGQGDGTLAGCQNNGYDANGNLLYKTDGRGVTASYAYDSLNRITNKSYVDGVTPGEYFTYDAGPGWMPDLQNVIGRLAFSNNQFGGSTTGKAAAATFSYDAMGRVVRAWEQTPSASPGGVFVYSGYDLAGHLTDITYPDGHHVQQTWNSAGRLATSNLVDINGTPASQTYLQSVSYLPDGSPGVTTLGNVGIGPQQTVVENNRLQVQSMSVTGNGSIFASKTYCYVLCTTGGSANNGNIWGITDNLSIATTRGFTYDGLNRLSDFYFGATHQGYTIDSFGNLSPLHSGAAITTFDAATNRINNLPCGSTVTAFDSGGNQLCDTDASGGIRQYSYDAESRLSQVKSFGSSTPFVTYDYGDDGNRARKGNADGTYTEYIYLAGQPIAEKDQAGFWTDYIYANGRKIAKVDAQKPLWHMHAVRDYSINMGCGVEGPAYGVGSIAGVQIASGDRLVADFKQVGVASGGGIALIFTDGTGTGSLSDSMTGTPFYFNTVADGTWHHMSGDLSAYAGLTASWVLAGLHNTMPVGTNDMWIANVTIVKTDGSVVSIFSGQNVSVGAYTGTQCGGYDLYADTETVAADPAVATNFYVGDHLGTAQMEFNLGGWPIWKGEFAPFGSELDTQPTSMHYKFTGQERDAETGQDHFMFRNYASSTGRWTSPDPYLGSYDMADPQSFNRYAYVRNEPMTANDPFGLNLSYAFNCSTHYESYGIDDRSQGEVAVTDCSWDPVYSGGSGTGYVDPISGPTSPSGVTTVNVPSRLSGLKKEWLPKGAQNCPGQSFFLPPGFNLNDIVAAGRAGGLSPKAALGAVGHYGKFDFQRDKSVLGNVFFSGYTAASNIAVGAYLYGAGFSEFGASVISDSFALTMSSNAGDPAQAYYRNLGYEAAASGKDLSCSVNP